MTSPHCAAPQRTSQRVAPNIGDKGHVTLVKFGEMRASTAQMASLYGRHLDSYVRFAAWSLRWRP
jgi:hypothetical protein